MSIPPTPFDNRSFAIGDLMLESASDVVAIHGSLDIRRDRTGLDAARVLARYMAALVLELDEMAAHGELPSEAGLVPPVQRANPLA